MARRLTFFLGLLLGLLPAAARDPEFTDSVLINFRQSKVYVDSMYMDNDAAFRHAKEMMRRYSHPDSAYVLTRVEVVGAASPEGSVDFNEWLSHERADRIFTHLSHSIAIPDSITGFRFLGRDWRGARAMAAADPATPYQAETVGLLDEIIASIHGKELESAQNLRRIKNLRGGIPYSYIYRHHFPALRKSQIVMTFTNPRPWIIDRLLPCELTGPVCDAPDLTVPASLWSPVRLPEVATPCRPFYMALKTNMPLDLLAIPNIGAEFYLGKDFSVVGNWMYGWWKSDRRHRYWRMYGGDLALRWWFGSAAHEKPLTGHHLGLYFGVFTFDFEWGGTGYMGGRPGHWLWDRYMTHAGVEYGYSLPIARKWNIDFTLGLGYLGGRYHKYDPEDKCYVWKSTHSLKWMGPTKFEISLTRLIGCDNYNRTKEKKGGGLW